MIDYIIGESYGFHDGAIAVFKTDGSVYFAEQTERHTGIKHDSNRAIFRPSPLGHKKAAEDLINFIDKRNIL